MVISDRTATGERVAEPKIAFEGDCVCGVGKGRSAFVGGNHKIRVVAVVDNYICWMNDSIVDDIVRNRQQRADEYLVALSPFRKPRVTVHAHVGQAFRVESALRPGRHDHRVFDALRLHQAEHFGAEIVAPIGPAQAAARDRASAQMDALDPRRIDEHLAPWQRRRQARHLRAI